MIDKRADQTYQHIYQLVQENHKAEASKLLAGLISANRSNPDLWYLATFVTDDNAKRLAAVKHALAINPNHVKANALLPKLQPVDDLDFLLASELASVPYEVQQARAKDYTNAFVICLVLCFVLWLPGLIATDFYYTQAKQMEKLAGNALPGVGALATLRRIVFILFTFAFILFVLILAGPAILKRI